MRTTKLFLSAALVVAGVSMAAAQSQPNFGPNAPSQGDSYGKPLSSAQPMPSNTKAYKTFASTNKTHKVKKKKTIKRPME